MFVLLVYDLVAFPVHPLPPLSVHVPVIVLFEFVHVALPPLFEQLGGVLSIFTV